jgi:hypothetical protein
MTIRDTSDNKVLGILQLMNRANCIRFTEQDVNHLGVLCSHLSQIFTYIFREGLLAQLSLEKQAVIANFVKVLSHKHKEHMK